MRASFLALAIGLVLGCHDEPTTTGEVTLERAWVGETLPGCVLASPLSYESADGPRAIAWD